MGELLPPRRRRASRALPPSYLLDIGLGQSGSEASMSASDLDLKAPQVGAVDMGNISFYNHPTDNPDGIPTFTLSDLDKFTGTFSEMVLNVTWAQLQSTENGPIDWSVI